MTIRKAAWNKDIKSNTLFSADNEAARLGAIACQYDEFISGEPRDKIGNAG